MPPRPRRSRKPRAKKPKTDPHPELAIPTYTAGEWIEILKRIRARDTGESRSCSSSDSDD